MNSGGMKGSRAIILSRRCLLAVALALTCTPLPGYAGDAPDSITVFAAASLTDVLEECDLGASRARLTRNIVSRGGPSERNEWVLVASRACVTRSRAAWSFGAHW